MTDDEHSDSERKSSKVARLINEYGLGDSFGDTLERLWTADGDQRESLRDLADRFNRRLLETNLQAAGASTVDGELENLYRLLTDDDVSSGMRTEARARLEREGVEIDRLERDFVTYQAIRSYLTEYRGAEYERPSESERADSVIETIQRLQSRLRSIAEEGLERLRSTDRLTLGRFRLFVDVDVLCEECGAQYGVVELFERGGCDCDPDEE
ncbi:rod-determining factor RdfA [Haloplanus salinarum]|uniref:rod-determining factor RdfA n=1 Tax=Haloplanus salinarum TaxID=1912324 RepID=UPI00214D11AD|nr:rod-determining factor RdfA [Haloplanus salinarum]